MSDRGLHILVCDDEPALRDMIGEFLSGRGHTVTLAGNAAEMDQALDREAGIKIALLDINMPGEDGLSILRRVKAERDLAVLMVTAAGDTIDRIVGLELGADDYLAKPVDLRELEARIRAVLRRPRQGSIASDPESSLTQQIRFGHFELDLTSARLLRDNGEAISLTAMEFRLLKVFVENRGRVLNRDQLLDLAHDRGWDPFDRSIDIRVSRLRRKIETNPSHPTLIRTVRGLGYVFDG